MSRDTRHPNRLRSLALLAAGFTLCAFAALPARAHIPRADRSWIETQRESLADLEPQLTLRATSPAGAVEAVRLVLRARADALLELGGTHPLTQPDGIETQDLYEDTVVRLLHRVAEKGLASETHPPPDGDAVRYAARIGEPPPLGNTPLGFMVLGLAAMAIQAHDEVVTEGSISEASANGLTLRLVRQATGAYVEAHVDALDEHQANQFRHNSVIMRMRCPEDDGSYRVTDQKNKMGGNDQFSTIYFLKCNLCYEPYELEYPLRYVSRLQQVSDRQKLRHDPEGTRPTDGLDP